MKFGKEEKFEFFCINEHTFDISPILPIRSLKIGWVDASRKEFAGDLKKSAMHMCSGIRGIASSGWVVTTWADSIITTNDDGNSISWHMPTEKVVDVIGAPPHVAFPTEKLGGAMPLLEGTLNTLIKVATPWCFKAPKGWGLLFLPLQYHGETRFYSSIGVLDPRLSNEINPILFWHSKNQQEFVKAGTPLCQLVPFRLDEFDFDLRMATEKELEWRRRVSYMKSTQYKFHSPFISKLYEKFFGIKK